MDTTYVGGFQLSALMLCALPTREKDMRVRSRAHEEQTNQEFRRKTTVVGFKTKQEFLSGDLNICLFYVSYYHIPMLASHTQPLP